jgi:pimeloyl-ACP methyl ester carboxylesterase
MDSRRQGKFGDSLDKITYEKMTDDLAALLDHLKSSPVYVLGWSDGGIEALLHSIRHPEKVKKSAAMAANVYPEGLHSETLELVKCMLGAIPPCENRHHEPVVVIGEHVYKSLAAADFATGTRKLLFERTNLDFLDYARTALM